MAISPRDTTWWIPKSRGLVVKKKRPRDYLVVGVGETMNQLYFYQKLKICHPHHEKISWSLDTFHFYTTRFSPGRAMDFFINKKINIKFTYPHDEKISWSLDTFHLNTTRFSPGRGVIFFKTKLISKKYVYPHHEKISWSLDTFHLNTTRFLMLGVRFFF